MIKLSDHFTLQEFTDSFVGERLGIDNTPPDSAIENLKRLAGILELVRLRLSWNPILITSGYRCPAINKLVGGTSNSAHLDGRAADLKCPTYGSPYGIAKVITQTPELMALIDQCILEYGVWVHIGIASEGNQPRREELTKQYGKPYERGINV